MTAVERVKTIDKYVGGLLSLALGAVKTNKPFTEPKSILLIQLWGIGETILTLPAIQATRTRFPHATISVLATKRNKTVFEHQPFIDTLHEVETDTSALLRFMRTNRKQYDLVIDFEEYLNISSLISYTVGKYRIGYDHKARAKLYDATTRYNDQQHVVETHLDLIRILDPSIKSPVSLLPLQVSPEDETKAQEVCTQFGHDGLIGLCPGSAESAKSRQWPVERFIELAQRLITKYNAGIVFIGSQEEYEEIKEKLSVLPQEHILHTGNTVTLPQAYVLIRLLDFVISNDTGPMHVAAAQGTPTIGLFGPNLPVRWRPYGKNHLALYHGYFCSPCINVHKGEVPECRFGADNKCMKRISVEEVLFGIQSILRPKNLNKMESHTDESVSLRGGRTMEAQDYLNAQQERVATAIQSMPMQHAEIKAIAEACIAAYKNGKKTIWFGNGGSAADAQHAVGELVGWYEHKNRPGIEAVALTCNSSSVTAIGNDTAYEEIFSRQVEAHVKAGDVVIGISTSGSSKNVLKALLLAKEKGAVIVGLTGRDGKDMNTVCDHVFHSPADDTPTIQTCHNYAYHAICGLIEQGVFGGQDNA